MSKLKSLLASPLSPFSLGVLVGVVLTIILISYGARPSEVNIGPIKFTIPELASSPVLRPVEEIVYVRIPEQPGPEIKLEVDYRYNPIRGKQVFLRACLLRKGLEANTANEIAQELVRANTCSAKSLVPTIGSGTASITIRPIFADRQTFTWVHIFLGENGKPDLIDSKTFPISYDWKP